VEVLWGEEVWLLLIHDHGIRWGWVVSVTPRPRFTPGERTPGTHCTGDWVGPRAGLDTEATGKMLCLCRGSNLNRPVVQSVARHYTHWVTRLPETVIHYNKIPDLISRSAKTSLYCLQPFYCWYFIQRLFIKRTGYVTSVLTLFWMLYCSTCVKSGIVSCWGNFPPRGSNK
jgi:hypothetical protein